MRLGSLASPQGETRFRESAGGGLFADVLVRADEVEDDSQGEDKVEQGLRLLGQSLAEAPALPWDVRVDGVDLSEDLLALEVMNVRDAGPTIPLAPQADAGDGILYAVLIGPADTSALSAYVDARLGGHSPVPPVLEVRKGLEIAFRPPPGCALHCDDEILTDGTASGLPGTLTVHAAIQVHVLVPTAPPQ